MDDLNRQIEQAKTDESELNEVLEKYDLDEQLAREFSEIDKAFRQLEIRYQSLVNARKFLNNG
jgi:phosphopantothenate synthetase